VEAARQLQRSKSGKLNAMLINNELEDVCKLTNDDQRLLHQVMERFQLSARAYHRILKVARTIADLEKTEEIATKQVTEAIGYRCLDRKLGY